MVKLAAWLFDIELLKEGVAKGLAGNEIECLWEYMIKCQAERHW